VKKAQGAIIGGVAVRTSPHAAPRQVVCVDRGAICWRGEIAQIATAMPFDAVYCHDDDAPCVTRAVASLQSA
jgi:hypothetical protein